MVVGELDTVVSACCRVVQLYRVHSHALNGGYVPHSPKECSVTFLLQGIDRFVRQCSTCALEALIAGIEVDEGEVEA